VISSLLTDLYQLTMAYGYWKLNMHNQEAVFQLIFRRNPFRGNYSIACGLGTAIKMLEEWCFTDDDISYLNTLMSSNGKPLFSAEFLKYLRELRLSCDIDAIPEGTIVFPNEPLIRVRGPLLQAQLLESILLNIINFQTLIATKSSRICQAAQGADVFEFGMRRAQGPDGALSATRAAYIGGCVATSNVLAGKLYDIPVRGTHAHSWVTAFSDELSAFSAYAEVMPNNCVLLVDTFDTLAGVANAIEVGKKLRNQGAELAGIRLDSGDLGPLSVKARAMLNQAGFSKTKIIASNSLDEHSIKQLCDQGAKIDIWGVGTHLVTAHDEPALEGVYKLSALRDADQQWSYKVKLSEQVFKISTPGIYQVRRFFQDEQQVMDILYDIELGIPETPTAQSFEESHVDMKVMDFDACVDLLVPVFEKGKLVYLDESIHKIRERAIAQATQFLKSYPKEAYMVGLETRLSDLKQKLIKELS